MLEATRLPVRPALTFSGSADKLNCGSGSSLDDLNTATVLVWVYPTSLDTAPRRIAHKGLLGSGFRILSLGTTAGEFRVAVERATVSLTADSTGAPVTTNAWQFLGGQWNTGGGDTDQKLFHGTLTTVVAEVSYSSRTAGSGAPISNASADQIIGNQSNNGNPFPGRIAWMGIWNRVLTLQEIRAQQFRPFCKSTDGCVLFVHLGWAGTGTQPDLSGNGNNCTVTGATVADHAPLVRWP